MQHAPDIAEDEIVAFGERLQALDVNGAGQNGHGFSLFSNPGGQALAPLKSTGAAQPHRFLVQAEGLRQLAEDLRPDRARSGEDEALRERHAEIAEGRHHLVAIDPPYLSPVELPMPATEPFLGRYILEGSKPLQAKALRNAVVSAVAAEVIRRDAPMAG